MTAHFDRLGWAHRKKVKAERTDFRTFFGKVFENADGTLSLKSQLGTPVHYREETLNPDSPFLDIDITPQRFSDRYEVNAGIYRLVVGDTGEVQYTSRAFGDLTWKPISIGGSTKFTLSSITHEVHNFRDFIVFNDIRPNVDMLIRIGSAKMEPLFRAKTPGAARDFIWQIDHSQDAYFTVGEGGRGVEAPNGKRRELEIAKTEGAPDLSNGRRKIVTEEVWSGSVWELDRDRNKVRRDNPKYPVLIDPPDVSESISAGSDDVWQNVVGSFFNTNSNIVVVYGSAYASFQFDCGLRFRSLAIPNAQGISAANLVVNCLSAANGGNVIFHADDVDSAAVWSASDGPFQITPTTAAATLAVSSAGAFSFDVASIIAEIIARSGWASGNNMRFAGSALGNVVVQFAAYEHGSVNPAKLDVTFAAGGGGGGKHVFLPLLGVG